ncbi:hypothetical protein CM318V1_530008 [Carnobacterium maltaromaticum]|uniref:hypothetical protein n=1 Tax=Carnobacterium maltaromaticum TaxID=2751 RepID=UPI000705084E|nr:hypothetical protein [Carnobacterium maltaromaticum]CAD5903228.1 conserved hypothetical protein [Carnobacterium maltaromaticum]CRH19711.1 hypothetical protein CM318V1_530008 [Carnobacterium maltaromaticum]
MNTNEKTDLLRYQLATLNQQYGVTISFIAKETGIATQHLTNFKNGKLVFGWKRLTILDTFLRQRYYLLFTIMGAL